jgi:hypothetical protein
MHQLKTHHIRVTVVMAAYFQPLYLPFSSRSLTRSLNKVNLRSRPALCCTKCVLCVCKIAI